MGPKVLVSVVAADVLCYFGGLDDVLAAAEAALRPGGAIAFTVESLADVGPDGGPEGGPDAVDGWSLALHGRYVHVPGYVAAVMARFDQVAADPCVLRMEAGLPVPGLVVSGRARGA